MGAIAEDVRRSGTLQAVNDAVSLNQPGTAVIAINLVVTGSNTTLFEASVDEGASPTWVAIKAINVNTGSLVSSATASGLFKVDNAGYRQFRVRCSVFASGSVVVVMNGSVSPSAPGLISAAAGGSGASTIADGADVALGSTTDAGIITNIAGTVIGFLRGSIIQWAAFLARFPAALVGGRLDVNLGAAPVTVSVAGVQVAGAGVGTNPLLVGGSDGTTARFLMTDTTGRPQVVGAAASAAAAAGNPVWIGMWDGATNIVAPVCGTPADGLGNSTGTQRTMAFGYAFNGATYDRMRANTTTVVQASTLTTVQTINTDIINHNGRAFMAHANVTIYNGGSILMKLQIKDANGLFTDIPGATTGTVTTGADVLLNVGPTVWPANTATMFNLNFFLPRQIRLVTTIATASVTFSQSYDLPAN